MGKSTISMAIFNCYVSSPEGNTDKTQTLFVHPKRLSSLARSFFFPQIPPQKQLSLDDLNHALKDDMPPMDRRLISLGMELLRLLRDFSAGEIEIIGFNMV